MAFSDDVVNVSGYLFETVMKEVQEMYPGVSEDEARRRIISRLLWHYSMLNLFMVDNDLGSDFAEWLTEKQAEGYYREG